jgi:hypothetical protein
MCVLFKQLSGLSGLFLNCELWMEDYISDDLDNEQNEQNDPVWLGIIFPGHSYKPIVHREV